MEARKAEVGREAEDVARREARLKPQEKELSGRAVTLAARETGAAEVTKEAAKRLKDAEVRRSRQS